MSDTDAFLRAIADAPDDDAPRLVFADWLDDHGDHARAEFIRVQCAAELLEPGDPRRTRLTDRADALLAESRLAWEADLPRDDHQYRRGFLDLVTVDGSAWADHLPTLAAIVPPVCIDVADLAEEQASEVAELPELAEIRRLRLSEVVSVHTDGPLAVLLRSPNLGRLTELDLSFVSGQLQDPAALADWPGLEHVESLTFQYSLEAAGIQRVLSSPRLTGLRRLTLTSSDCTDAVTACPSLGRLEELTVAGWADNLVRALIRSGRACQLRELRASGGHSAVTACLEALASPSLPRLRRVSVSGYSGSRPQLPDLPQEMKDVDPLQSLSLEGADLGDDGAGWLARLPRLAGLTVLSLSMCGISHIGAAALARSPFLAGVRCLDLNSNPFGVAGVRALAEGPGLLGLESLDLVRTDPGVRGIESFRRAAWVRSLIELDLRGNRLTRTAVTALARTPFDSLRTIGLGYESVEWEGIADAEWFDRLEVVRLAGIDNRGLIALANRLGPAVRTLELLYGEFDGRGLRALLARPLTALRSLDLCGSRVGVEGVRALAAWPGLARLTAIGLDECGVGTASVRALTASPYLNAGCIVRVGGTRAGQAVAGLRERVYHVVDE